MVFLHLSFTACVVPEFPDVYSGQAIEYLQTWHMG